MLSFYHAQKLGRRNACKLIITSQPLKTFVQKWLNTFTIYDCVLYTNKQAHMRI